MINKELEKKNLTCPKKYPVMHAVDKKYFSLITIKRNLVVMQNMNNNSNTVLGIVPEIT